LPKGPAAVLATLEKLAELKGKGKGILTDEEF